MSWYLDFVDLDYKPSKNDLICTYFVQPAKGISLKEAAGRVVSESSVGTWTSLSYLPKRVEKLMARVFEIKENVVRIAYPIDLFEAGNIPQILSSIAGNIFGMKAIENLRLEDVQWPRKLIKSFKGPQFGIRGVRKIMKVRKRPLIATVPKPKVGLSSKEYARIAYELWIGGVDFVKDDENLTDLKFNKFEERLKACMKMRENAEKETGERKCMLINVTGKFGEMKKRIELVAEYGNEFIMIDGITCGFSSLQEVRDVCQDYGIAIHMHRAMHAAFTRKKHGISMKVIAQIARIIGVDNLHRGTAIGKMAGSRKDVLEIKHTITKQVLGLRKVFPVTSGGLHPGLIPTLLEIFGKNIIIQVGGGVMGHPAGARAGAKAVRQAICAALRGISLKECAKKHVELREALKKWGYRRPR